MEESSEKNKKILTYILVTFMLLVVGTAAVYLFLLQSGEGTPTNTDLSVADEITTEEVTVTNIGSSVASISWYTPQTSNGYVVYGLASDTLDQTMLNPDTSEKNAHHIDLTNLDADQTYFFQIQGENETVTNSATYNFNTIAQSEDVNTPSTLLITLPATFSEGIVYAHASDGSVVSPAASTYTFSNSTSLDIGVLKKSTEGDAFLATDAGIVISATAIDGSRYTSKFTLDASKVEMTNADATTTAYSPNTIFVPLTSTASEDPVVTDDDDDDDVVTPPVVVSQDPTPTPTTPVVVVPVTTPLPSTAIGDKPERDLALLLGATSFILGFKLLLGTNKESEDFY